jgi:hypothetical protein
MQIISIIRNSDGLLRTYVEDFEWLGEYIWAEGNFSCDCNRGLFFDRAGGDEPEWAAHDCGETGYSIRICDEDGNILYDELAANSAERTPVVPVDR